MMNNHSTPNQPYMERTKKARTEGDLGQTISHRIFEESGLNLRNEEATDYPASGMHEDTVVQGLGATYVTYKNGHSMCRDAVAFGQAAPSPTHRGANTASRCRRARPSWSRWQTSRSRCST